MKATKVYSIKTFFILIIIFCGQNYKVAAASLADKLAEKFKDSERLKEVSAFDSKLRYPHVAQSTFSANVVNFNCTGTFISPEGTLFNCITLRK